MQSNRHYNPRDTRSSGAAGGAHFDIVAVGGGPVALAFACAAAGSARGASVAVVARERAAAAPAPGTLDARVYTLSPGNVEFLQSIGAWQALEPGRVTPVRGMRVFGDRDGAEIRFDAYAAGVPEVGWTVEDSVLQAALWRAAGQRNTISVLAPAECERIELDAKQASIHLRGGSRLNTALVLGADGANSFVREQAGIAVQAREYGQSAVVANFACGKPHQDLAYQWFQGGPVLALLPLPGNRVSMVWSLAHEEAQRISGLDPESLCREVEQASSGLLGALELVTAPKSYPLRRLAARRMSGTRVALAGDAAHVIHPLAGQGLNLGLQDARVLATLVGSREPVRDAGDARLLRRYERSRAEPILAMDLMVDGLFRLFGAQGEWLARARNTGLNLTGRITVLKNLLIRHAMS